MSRPPLLDPQRSYTFSNYFDLGVAVDELVAEFSYELKRRVLTLPQQAGDLDFLADIGQQLVETLSLVDLANEATRREILIAPVVSALARYTQANLRIEYGIRVNQQLQGKLDYYLWKQQNLLIIEAKQADLSRGFTQLAMELIALDEWTSSPTSTLIGAVTTGNLWQFGIIDRTSKVITQGLNSYRVPEDLEALFRILLAVLTRSC